MATLATPLKIAPATLAKLAKIGIHHRADLLLHLPLRYEDETHLTPIAQALPGETVQVQGEVTHCEVMFRPRRTLVCRIQQGDEELILRFLNFYPSQQKQLAVGKQIRAIGEVRGGFFGLEMVHPKCKSVDDDTPLPQSLSPVYPTTAGLSQTVLRKLIDNALQSIPLSDTLPAPLVKRLKLADFSDSLRLLHNPTPDISASTLEARSHSAWRRIKFDELLAQQLSMRVHHRERSKRIAPALPAHDKLTHALLDKLPFQLTGAQQKVWGEIAHDLTQSHPMQRLLLGDVGSGKTVVAALAALQAIENGYQVAFMAPTEILAEQHYLKLHEWLAPLGIEPVWLSGSQKKKAKTEAAARISSGDTLLAIGTHALFQKDVEFHKLGLAIIDEQHKFGVQQRLALRNKGKEPHQLMMSATPIPRTLAMSYYADLDVSVIDELPPGRTPIVTKLVSDSRREEVFERVRVPGAGRPSHRSTRLGSRRQLRPGAFAALAAGERDRLAELPVADRVRAGAAAHCGPRRQARGALVGQSRKPPPGLPEPRVDPVVGTRDLPPPPARVSNVVRSAAVAASGADRARSSAGNR
jgi:ATP-dependent DNA helicase RecG